MPFLPLQQTEDDPDFAKMPSLGFWGATNTYRQEQGVLHDTTPELVEKYLLHKYPGKQMTSEEYEQSEFKRPGISFPKGVTSNQAMISANRFDAEQDFNRRLSGTTNGFLKGAGALAGKFIGWLQDPVNMGSMIGVGRAAKLIGEPLVSAVAETGLGRAVARGVVGAAEATAVTLPSETVDYITEKNAGEGPNIHQVFEGLLLNAGLGGIIHTSVGALGDAAARRAITKTSHVEALRAAASQLEQGKSPNVEMSIKNGAYQQDFIDDARRPAESTDELKSQYEADNARGELNENFQKTRTIAEPADLQKVGDELSKAKEDLEGIEGTEKIQDELGKHAELAKAEMEGRPLDISNLEHPVNFYRDFDLSEMPNADATKVVNAVQSLNDNLGRLSLQGIDRSPVTQNALKASADNLKSVWSNYDMDIAEHRGLQRSINTIKDKDINELRAEIEPHLENLPKDLQEAYAKIPEDLQASEEIASSMKDYANCMGTLI